MPGDQAPQNCNLFIAYRQGANEGDACAAWLHDQLEGSNIHSPEQGLSKISFYWDRDAAAIEDWREQWRVALKTCRALILVCSPGTRDRRTEHDWLHHELDWWITHRKTAPLLVDSCGLGAEGVPERIAAKWPYAQRVLWTDDEGTRGRVLEQLREGIVLSESGVTNEELRSSTRKTRGLFALTVCLILLGIVVGVVSFMQSALSNCANSAVDASRSVGHMGPDPRALVQSGIDCEAARAKSWFIGIAGAALLSVTGLLIGITSLSWLVVSRRRHI